MSKTNKQRFACELVVTHQITVWEPEHTESIIIETDTYKSCNILVVLALTNLKYVSSCINVVAGPINKVISLPNGIEGVQA